VPFGASGANILKAVVAEDLPDPGSVFLGIELKFGTPMYVDDTITTRVELASVREDKPIYTLKVSVSNQKGEVRLSSVATTYTAPMKKV
jgi:acyl dehydratase